MKKAAMTVYRTVALMAGLSAGETEHQLAAQMDKTTVARTVGQMAFEKAVKMDAQKAGLKGPDLAWKMAATLEAKLGGQTAAWLVLLMVVQKVGQKEEKTVGTMANCWGDDWAGLWASELAVQLVGESAAWSVAWSAWKLDFVSAAMKVCELVASLAGK